jgi:hypothetical protein
MKCPICGYEKETAIHSLINNGFACICNDVISYPEKFMINLLSQISISFIKEQIFIWSNNRRYDFYIPKINCIIETHGKQHYEETTGNFHWDNLIETQENDNQKEKLAKDNRVKNYIVIDCRKSELEWIKNNITKRDPSRSDQPCLAEVLNFKEEDIDWLKCHEYACNSLVKKTCDLWNEGFESTSKIADILKLNSITIVRYLKQGVQLGWCDYYDKRFTKIICMNNLNIYDSCKDAINKLNIKNLYPSNLSKCCIGIRKFAGVLPDGTKLRWMYYKDYLNNKELISTTPKSAIKVICISTNEIFNSISDIIRHYDGMVGISTGSISRCCKGTRNSAGKHPETGEKLRWMYYDEYTKLQEAN